MPTTPISTAGRRWLLAALLTGALGVPYGFSSLFGEGQPIVADDDGSILAIADEAIKAATSPEADKAAASTTTPAIDRGLTGGGTAELSRLLSFDMTQQQVLARWSRVTTGLADVSLQGYRVPLVTGTSQADVAGSLTYYFNSKGELRRITCEGTTGDPKPLVSAATSLHGLEREVTENPSETLYQSEYNGEPLNRLSIRLARLIRADDPNSRYEFKLLLQKPPESTGILGNAAAKSPPAPEPQGEPQWKVFMRDFFTPKSAVPPIDTPAERAAAGATG